MLVAGAAWPAKADSPQDTGRQPLAVEAVTATHAAELIPGVITTTPHARFLSLHARVAVEAQRRGWRDSGDRDAFRELLRRAEVVLSAVSVHHAAADPDGHKRRGGTAGPHGVNTIKRWMNEDDGAVDIAGVAAEYSNVAEGLLGTYSGIEVALGLIVKDGDVPGAGPVADAGELAALDEVIRLAGRPRRLTSADLGQLVDLCLCRVADAPDGACLRRAFFGAGAGASELVCVHRRSAEVLATALDGEATTGNVDLLMDRLCCFTPELATVFPDPDVRDHALRWRGALLRNWSVWAWRILWARLVDPLQTPGTRGDAVAAFTADLPHATVQRALLDRLPPLVDAHGALLPAEHVLNDSVVDHWTVYQLLQLLAVGAGRVDGLDEVSREAFLRNDRSGWGPTWVRDWLDRTARRPLREAAAELAMDMFGRAEAVSRQKMQWTRRGLRMPTRLRTVGDRLVLEGREGEGSASLRLDTFTNVIRQLGIVAASVDGTRWTLGAHSAQVLG